MEKCFERFVEILKFELFGGNRPKIFPQERAEVESLFSAHCMSGIYSEFCGEKSRQRERVTYKSLMQKNEFDRICAAFAEQNIRYIPLKGVSVASLYPNRLFREMADLDLFADRENFPRIREIFEKNGYVFFHKGHHDVFEKPPGICFEIHETLLDRQRDTGMEGYFSDPWKLSVPDGEACYRLTSENEYIYLMAHFFGHFHQGGIGVKNLLDLYLYRQKKKPDEAMIEQVLEQHGLLQFYQNVKAIGELWFGGGESTALLEEMGEYIITSRAYGLTERLNLDLAESESGRNRNLGKMLKRKLFLSKSEINRRYPWSKNRLLLPFAYAKRVCHVIGHHGQEAREWARVLRETDEEKIRAQKEKMKRFGAVPEAKGETNGKEI